MTEPTRYQVARGDIIRVHNIASPGGPGVDTVQLYVSILSEERAVDFRRRRRRESRKIRPIEKECAAPGSLGFASGTDTDIEIPYNGWIIGMSLSPGSVYLEEGDNYQTVRVMDRGKRFTKYYLAKGGVGPQNPLELGELRPPTPFRRSDYTETTLVNNTAASRSLTVPLVSLWETHGGILYNGDDVARDCSVGLRNSSGQELRSAAAKNVPATDFMDWPRLSDTAALNRQSGGSGYPFPLGPSDDITFTWNAGGASSGGTGASSAVAMQRKVQ